jgi:pimeloyl-ACP methyl ester carboxylesterase
MPRPPVLLVHGFGSSFERNWREPGWVDVLVDTGRTVIELDLPGHGRAPRSHDPADYAGLHQAVAAAVPPGVIVDAVGFSLGARLLLRAAAEEPDRYHRLVVAGVGNTVFRTEGPDSAEAVARSVETGALEESAGPTARALAVFAQSPGNDPAALAACLRAPDPPLSPGELSGLRRPVLVVLGDRDPAWPADALVDALPDGRLVALAGVDHFATPKDYRFIDAVIRFLDEPAESVV